MHFLSVSIVIFWWSVVRMAPLTPHLYQWRSWSMTNENGPKHTKTSLLSSCIDSDTLSFESHCLTKTSLSLIKLFTVQLVVTLRQTDIHFQIHYFLILHIVTIIIITFNIIMIFTFIIISSSITIISSIAMQIKYIVNS